MCEMTGQVWVTQRVCVVCVFVCVFVFEYIGDQCELIFPCLEGSRLCPCVCVCVRESLCVFPVSRRAGFYWKIIPPAAE